MAGVEVDRHRPDSAMNRLREFCRALVKRSSVNIDVPDHSAGVGGSKRERWIDDIEVLVNIDDLK